MIVALRPGRAARMPSTTHTDDPRGIASGTIARS